MSEEDKVTGHKEPCEPHRTFVQSIKWVISVMIVVGGAGVAFAVSEAKEAKVLAKEATDKAQNVSILENEIQHLRDDMKEVKASMKDVEDIKVSIAEMAGDMKLTLEKVKTLQRSE